MNNAKLIHCLNIEDISSYHNCSITETKFAKWNVTCLYPNVVPVAKVSYAKYSYLHYLVQEAWGEVFFKQYSPLPSK